MSVVLGVGWLGIVAFCLLLVWRKEREDEAS
jgi:hypothetical protein